VDVFAALDLKPEQSGTYLGGGQWSTTRDAGVLHSINPATGEELGRVYCAAEADYETLVGNAQAAFQIWRTLPAPKRGEAIRLVTETLRANKAALGALVTLEMGKIKAEGLGEVQEMIDIGDFAVGQSRMLYGQTMHSERPLHRMYEQWHPLGVIGVISAFNFPVAVWAWNAFLAAICGNVTIWKPSPRTPLCAVAVQNLCNRALKDAGFPEIFFLFSTGGIELAQAFVDDRRIPLMSFTGSTQVGRQVAERVAQRLGRSLLELGGNNAMIIAPSANLDMAIPSIVFGSVGTAGQRCTSTRRVLVHESIADNLIARLVKAYGQVRIGAPIDDGTLMGPLNSLDAVGHYLNAVARAKAEGGEIQCGGKRIERPGNFVEPTIFKMPKQSAIVEHETFAPILYVLTYSTLDEAIALQNAVPQGLSSSIFTNDLREAEQFLSAVGSDCGIANVNIGTSGAEIGGAFGGEKDTGGGRESGSDSWKAYMRRQTNTINWGSTLPLAQGIRFDL
jgi:aldehyde dehydrogenase (NAD+)